MTPGARRSRRSPTACARDSATASVQGSGEIRLDTLDDLVNMVAREINDEISKLVARVKDMEIRVTTAFDKFRDQFPRRVGRPRRGP